MRLVEGADSLDAWRGGCRHLIGGYQGLIVTKVARPWHLEPEWLTENSPVRFGGNSSLSDVINTIFPRKLSDRFPDRQELYHQYLLRHNYGRRLSAKKHDLWGTYFQRLISFGDSEVNQLEEIITVICEDRRWLRVFNPMHISSAETDSLRKRLGNPCLQYIQVVQPVEGTLDLVAVYRRHDFFEKALGNFVGLGLLLRFICDSGGKNPGVLTCISSGAYNGGSRENLRRVSAVE